MTKKITVSVSDEVAERLGREANVSAFVTAAVQRQMMAETTRHQLEQAGFSFTEERLDQARREFDAARAQMTPELRSWARAVIAQVAPHRLAQAPGA